MLNPSPSNYPPYVSPKGGIPSPPIFQNEIQVPKVDILKFQMMHDVYLYFVIQMSQHFKFILV